MSRIITIARPYANAAFEYARDEGVLANWAEQLEFLALVVKDPQMSCLLDDSRLTRKQRADLLLKVCGDKLDKGAVNLVNLLADNGRLQILPDIFSEFELLRADHEGKIEAVVSSAKEIPALQQKKIIQSLEKRLQKKVTLKCEIDPTLIGGAVIKAGDLVIDGTLKTRLSKMNAALLRQ
ncbi:MAG: F0F1 ATP synthase subunit delta [Gammaproteobacteria bacterium]|nr:F0F1 ATP synthase subunit delta [Gammaproteobacteria bacterium]